MLKIERFVNQLMTSNCYIVYDNHFGNCIVIDPGSQNSEREIEFIKANNLHLDYIIITHEHSDHTWGVNALIEKFKEAKVVCSEICAQQLPKASDAYFSFYFDDPDYHYEVEQTDILVNEIHDNLTWNDLIVKFWVTPGHSYGSMCVSMGNVLFTGDTIMPYKPYFNGRDSNENDWHNSVRKIIQSYSDATIVYPGHGDSFALSYWIEEFFDK